ncbi:hypothetical protein [Dictyobacter arantiisoli]|uniref:hypothetical protein n=1 Tax=Dictyobacter arantiisoli TaxID=2014874 RepID=UPI003FCDC602
MNEPITTRHGRPDGVVTPWEETRRVLETAELFWLSTVRPTVALTSRRSWPCGTTGPSTLPLPTPHRRLSTCVKTRTSF